MQIGDAGWGGHPVRRAGRAGVALAEVLQPAAGKDVKAKGRATGAAQQLPASIWAEIDTGNTVAWASTRYLVTSRSAEAGGERALMWLLLMKRRIAQRIDADLGSLRRLAETN